MLDKKLLLVLILFVSTQTFAFDFPTGRADALGRTTTLSTPFPSEQLINGSGFISESKLSIDFGYKRQYDLKELDIAYAAFSYTRKNYTIVGGLSQLGDVKLYTQKQMRVGLLFSKSKITFGGYINGEFHQFNNHYTSLHRYDYSFSLLFRHKYFIVSSVIDNIAQTSLSNNSTSEKPILNIFGELIGTEKYKTTFHYAFINNKPNKIGIGETIEISRQASVLFGFSTAPVEFGGGFEMKWKEHSLIYNSSYHPVLGMTHTISFFLKIIDN